MQPIAVSEEGNNFRGESECIVLLYGGLILPRLVVLTAHLYTESHVMSLGVRSSHLQVTSHLEITPILL